MSKKHYFESDGNGGYKISKSIALPAFIMMVITIIAFFVQAVIATNNLQNDVNFLKDEYNEGKITHPKVINGLSDRIVLCEKNIETTNVKLANIEKKLDEIRLDIKELRK